MTLRRPFKSDDLRAPLSPPKPANEPAAPATDEASAEPATDARERGGDKSAGGKSFYDSLEQEMASLLNRPPSKP